jgi:hypothetical protein
MCVILRETGDDHFVEGIMGVNKYGIPGGLSSESTRYISIRRTRNYSSLCSDLGRIRLQRDGNVGAWSSNIYPGGVCVD